MNVQTRKVYTSQGRPLIIDDNSAGINTTYSSDKIEELTINKTETTNWQSGKIVKFGADGRLENSGREIADFSLSNHNHDASDVVIDNTNFGAFLPLGINSIQKLADWIDDYFTEIQEQGNEVIGEVPGGAINSANTSYYILYTPLRHTLFLNGVRQKNILDYTISGNIINFISPPIPGDIILIDYSY